MILYTTQSQLLISMDFIITSNKLSINSASRILLSNHHLLGSETYSF